MKNKKLNNSISDKKEVELDFDEKTLMKLFMLAHEEDLTLNQYVENILKDQLKKFPIPKNIGAKQLLNESNLNKGKI
jgi:hypothetical protein